MWQTGSVCFAARPAVKMAGLEFGRLDGVEAPTGGEWLVGGGGNPPRVKDG
jgi:hypothetical protein